MKSLLGMLEGVKGVERRFDSGHFHEAVLKLDMPVAEVCEKLRGAGVIAGYALEKSYPELGDSVLVCATETRSEADLQHYADTMSRCFGGD